MLLFLLCFVNKSSALNHSDYQQYLYSTYHANHIQLAKIETLQLKKGDVCKEDLGLKSDYICVNKVECKPSSGDIKSTEHFEICSFDGSQPIICCPSSAIIHEISKRDVQTSIADAKCYDYSILPFLKDEISSKLTSAEKYLTTVLEPLGGPRVAQYQEFPHMAMIGYGETPEEMYWRCSGSLISEKWILTAAHCRKMGSLARWARLGDVDRSPVNPGWHKDYRINYHVLHPNYKVSERYYDIALFRLGTNVQFSSSIRPICLNTDPSLDQTDYPTVNVWGKVFEDNKLSDVLIQVPLRHIPTSACSKMYNPLSVKDSKLPNGIDKNNMLCTSTLNFTRQVCTGDPGGALQILHRAYQGAYVQLGVTSFGLFCDVRRTFGVYTRVSKFVEWIEKIVWPTENGKKVLPAAGNQHHSAPGQHHGASGSGGHHHSNQLWTTTPATAGTRGPSSGAVEEVDNDPDARISVKKCRQYGALGFPRVDNSHTPIVGGHPVHSKEFTHMALIGYGETTEDENDWKCGGSLISERWILSAAHCHTISNEARWARLGELDFTSTTDDAQPIDYRIVEHVLHPDYKPSARYHDIALFRLESDVIFSVYVRPICLNSDPFLNPARQHATGWGRVSTDGPQSNTLLEVGLDIVPPEQCKEIYSSIFDTKLKHGIQSDSMICAGSIDGKDTCSGDSGGPLQKKFKENFGSYVQFGITSFGPAFCGNNKTPAVFTKVSKYIQWIENIVWPEN